MKIVDVIYLTMSLLYCSFGVTTAFADTNPQLCKEISETAVTLMVSRQNNVPKSEVVKISPTDGALGKIMKEIIDKAWEAPIYQTDSEKLQVANAFGGAWFQSCMTSK